MTPWSDEPLEEREYPDDADIERGGEPAGTVPCRSCGAPMLEETEKCPYCGEWVTSWEPTTQSSKWYMRFGMWAAKTILLNWLFWIGLSAGAIVAAILRWLK